MRVLTVIWIGNYGVNTTGIIKAQDTTTEEIKYYMGIGKGLKENEDIKLILRAGQKYSAEQFKGFFKDFLED